MHDFKKDFPLLSKKHSGRPLVYFDNAATTPKPQMVIDAVCNYYVNLGANVKRSQNFLSEDSTIAYESARKMVANFIGAGDGDLVFMPGASVALNIIARLLGENLLKPGDVVALSRAEHHSNLVPWLQLKERLGIIIVYIDINQDGSLSENSVDNIFEHSRLKIISLTQASNVLGQFLDLSSVISRAREREIITIVDASQSVAHHPLSAADSGVDFLVFSGHKCYGPSGVGVLWSRRELLAKLPPFFGGGGMIESVSWQSFKPSGLPDRFEAGTPAIEAAIGLGAACSYLSALGWEKIINREKALIDKFLGCLDRYPAWRLLGGRKSRLPLFSLVSPYIHPHDAADILGERGFILRAGSHCAQPLHESLGVTASLRASLSFYNTEEEIEDFFAALAEVSSIFSA